MSEPRRMVASPCISLCRIEPASGLCAGCFRTLDEIALWGALTDEQKHEVWQEISARRTAAARGDGG